MTEKPNIIIFMSSTSGMGNWGVTAPAPCEETTPGGSEMENLVYGIVTPVTKRVYKPC